MIFLNRVRNIFFKTFERALIQILLLTIMLLINWGLYSQEYSSKDIIGTWVINKCELFINGELIKTASVNNYGDINKLVEGKSAGTHDQEVITIIKSVLGTEITFNEDSTFVWDGNISEFNFNNGYWSLENTGEILFGESKNKLKQKSVLTGRVTIINNEEVRITLFESGLEGIISLIKKI